MKTREFKLHETNIEVWKFSNASYFYPTFNGDAEFKVNKEGFKNLSSYIRTLNWFNKYLKE